MVASASEVRVAVIRTVLNPSPGAASSRARRKAAKDWNSGRNESPHCATRCASSMTKYFRYPRFAASWTAIRSPPTIDSGDVNKIGWRPERSASLIRCLSASHVPECHANGAIEAEGCRRFQRTWNCRSWSKARATGRHDHDGAGALAGEQRRRLGNEALARTRWQGHDERRPRTLP